MNLFKFAVAAIAAFSFSAIANQVEPIMGYSVDFEGISYQVSSGGCTKKRGLHRCSTGDFSSATTIGPTQNGLL